ncbi:MAG TPA: glycoside hydrolase family 38 C-terminal domain-containing protein [Acidimicrobiales bacterium]|nr:glycoside hydrolase family 38 C-terminal domain-containing protein [Acidimicrobiales bacterium]
MVRAVAIVPHTHWDREWYAPFQTFRLRLVDILDDLLPRLESDPSYAHFLLDGQLAVVDDYLEVRPDAEERLRRLTTSGRVSIGPWYVLPDEFLVSGETLVRNLEFGMARAAAYGGGMPVGYLPDMFGHVAQMPQLLRQAGFEHAVVWRGVPSAVDRTAFWWTAPDGSTVRAEYLPVGYGNGAAVPDDAKQLVARIRAHEAELGPLLAPDSALLWMNGTDHQAPQPWLGRVVAEANDIQDDYRLTVASLREYLPAAPTDGLPTWTGELRSGARANLLMGVASNRVDVKQAAARAERSLERRAEPLSALFLPPAQWPGALLNVAWMAVVRNAAHDSVCACSADVVVDAVLHRYAEATQIGDGLARRALDALGQSIAVDGAVIVNPAARTRSGAAELTLAGDDLLPDEQLLEGRAASVERHTVLGTEVSLVTARLAAAVPTGTAVLACEITENDSLDVVLRTGVGAPSATTASALCDLYARAGARRDEQVQVTIQHEAFRRVLVRAEAVPGFGWRAWDASTLEVEPAWADERGMGNGVVHVTVDPATGTFSIDGLAGLDRLVDSGDAGDTYNYSPPARDVIVDTPVEVAVTVVEKGPVRAVLRVTRRFIRTDEHIDVVTDLTLNAGERLVRVTTAVENRGGDHRLRAVFPLPEQATTSQAESAFAIVERGLGVEGGPHELPLPTFPSRRFVRAGGLTLVHEGLLEYELVDSGRALALTLLRCVGVLSGTHLALRPMPAGPPLEVAGAQMIGRQVLRYGVAVGDCDPYALADDAFLPLEVTSGENRGDRVPRGTALAVSGAEVSALRHVDGALHVRVFNPTDTEATVEFDARHGWLVDLCGRPVEPFDGSFSLAPWRIATVRLAGP